jgi:hypothetical protein
LLRRWVRDVRSAFSRTDEKGWSMSKPTGPTGTAVRMAAQLQRRVDELQETLEILSAKCEQYRTENEFWRNVALKRIQAYYGKPV